MERPDDAPQVNPFERSLLRRLSAESHVSPDQSVEAFLFHQDRVGAKLPPQTWVFLGVGIGLGVGMPLSAALLGEPNVLMAGGAAYGGYVIAGRISEGLRRKHSGQLPTPPPPTTCAFAIAGSRAFIVHSDSAGRWRGPITELTHRMRSVSSERVTGLTVISCTNLDLELIDGTAHHYKSYSTSKRIGRFTTRLGEIAAAGHQHAENPGADARATNAGQ